MVDCSAGASCGVSIIPKSVALVLFAYDCGLRVSGISTLIFVAIYRVLR